MRAFVRVAEEGAFAKAARALQLSPAGMTRLVADLEQHLGARLLQRTTRKLALTEAGEAYLLRARGILHEIDDAEAAAGEHARQLSGTLHLLATPVLASHFIAPRMAAWTARHPGVRIDLRTTPFPQSRVEEFDVTFMVVEQGIDLNIVARPLLATEWIVCGSPAYFERAGTPATPHDLRRHAYLGFQWPQRPGQSGRQVHLQRPDHDDVVALDLVPTLQSDSFDVLLRATLDGVGIAFLSRLMAAPLLRRGRLLHVLPDWIFGRFAIYAALPTRKLVPARTRAFLDFMAEPAPRAASR